MASPAAPPSGEQIYVAVRLRPLNELELYRARDVSVWSAGGDGRTLRHEPAAGARSAPPAGTHAAQYAFDRVFGPDARNEEVYREAASPLVRSALAGVTCTLFAYGQTGGGKTHTMKSVMESASTEVFDLIKATPGREFLLRLSAVEIYNEVVRDLLAEDTSALRLLDNPQRGTVVEGAREEPVRSPRHLRHLLSLLEPRRQVGDNGMHEASSRSHLVVRLTIESRAPEPVTQEEGDASACATSLPPPAYADDGPARGALVASMFFVDLAGSERSSRTGAEGKRLKEGCHINRSLLTLGTVIRKLAAGGSGAHVPYRDSKLTRILAHALGGSGRSAVICCASPAAGALEATRASLLFAENAKRVTNYAQVNETVDHKVLLRQYQAEIAALRAQLARVTATAAAPGGASASALADALAGRVALEKRLRGLELFILSSRPLAITAPRGRTAERGFGSPGWDPSRPRSWSPEATPRRSGAAPSSRGASRSRLARDEQRAAAGTGPFSARRLLRYEDEADDESETDGSDMMLSLHALGARAAARGPSAVAAAPPPPDPVQEDISALEGVGGLRGEEAGRALAAEMRCLRIHTVVGNLSSSIEEAELMARLQGELEVRLAAEWAAGAASKAEDADTVSALRLEVARLQGRAKAERAADVTLAALNERLQASKDDLDRYAQALTEANARADAAEQAARRAAEEQGAGKGVSSEAQTEEADENQPPQQSQGQQQLPRASPAADAASPTPPRSPPPRRTTSEPLTPRSHPVGVGAASAVTEGGGAGGTPASPSPAWLGPRLVGGLLDTWQRRDTPVSEPTSGSKPPTLTPTQTPAAAAASPTSQQRKQQQPAAAATGAWVPRSELEGERQRRANDMSRLQECLAGAAAEGAALQGHLMRLRDELQRAEFQKKRLMAQVLKLEVSSEEASAQRAALTTAAANERRRRRREQARRREAEEVGREALRRCETVAAAAAAAGAMTHEAAWADGGEPGALALAGHLVDSWAGPPTAAWYLPKITRLWLLLHIPLLHRSRFYLGFRGRETFYWDAEHRRLAWLHSTLKAARQSAKGAGQHPLWGAQETLQRERGDLARRLRGLAEAERLRLYADFGVDPQAKARKRQLAERLWADAADVGARGASAELVLRLHSLVPGQDLAVVFAPSFC